MHHGALRSRGTTLPELLATLTISAIVLAITIPRMRTVAERNAVRGATSDVIATLSSARQLAVAHRGAVWIDIDTSTATLRVRRDADTLMSRHLRTLFGVDLHANRDSLAYDARGLGAGAANLTFIVQRGSTADTVVVSRLGRVRW